MPGYSFIRLMILLLFSKWLIAGVSYAQSENSVTAQQLSRHLLHNYADRQSNTDLAIQQVNSIAHSNTISSPFCKVYYNSMKNIEYQIKDFDPGAKAFIQKFETGFADYFLRAWVNEKNKNETSLEWKCFFSNPNVKPWQLVLLGVNAHTNVNVWQALVANFSEEEVRHYKKQMLAMQSSIAKVYDQFFDTLLANNSYVRFINTFTLGIAKKFGERIVYKWRRRNVNLAIMYYHNPGKFKKKLAIVNRKKEKIDQRILRYRS